MVWRIGLYLLGYLTAISAGGVDHLLAQPALTRPEFDRPNFLLTRVNDMRPELGCNGANRVHSPNLEALSASGVTFDRSYVLIALCNPSQASMLTEGRTIEIPAHAN